MALLTAVIAAVAVPVADAAAPACWMGAAGCRHSTTSYFDLTSFTGSVTVTGSAPAALTCADAATATREEVVKGRYRLDLAADRRRSQLRVGSKPLALRLKVTRSTTETVRVLTPNGTGGCTESTRECTRGGSIFAREDLAVTTRTRSVLAEMRGGFVNDAFLPCAAKGLNVAEPLDTELVSDTIPLRQFRRRTSAMIFGGQRTPVVSTGDRDVSWRGSIRFARTLRQCTFYGADRKPIRCRTARG